MPIGLPALLGALGGAPASGPRTLVANGQLLSPLALARAQVSARAAVLGADGLTWSDVAADVARFHGTARRLLTEGQRTNAVRNPRCEGTAGALPTNWNIATQSVGGITATVLSRQAVNGVDCITIQLSGTAAASGTWFLNFDTINGTVAANGSVWTAGLFHRLDAAPAPPASHQLQVQPRISNGALNGAAITKAIVPGAALARDSLTATMPVSGNARVTSAYQATLVSGQAYNWTVTLGWPTLEQAAFGSSPALPPAGTPQSATRGADLVTAALSGLAIGGPFTVLWSGMLPQQAGSGADQLILQLDDGTDSNRVRIRNIAGGTTLAAGIVVGSTATDATALGALTPGSPFRLGLTRDGAGRVAALLGGGTLQAVNGAPGGLTTLRLGNNAIGAAPLFGETTELSVLATAASDAALPGLVAALPL
jgi:hypothetical protein